MLKMENTSTETYEANVKEFKLLCSKITRDGIDKLMKWLEKSDFYEAPASSRYHGAYKGGLLQHSLNVYHELVKLLTIYPEIKVPEESVIIASLFHDLCKVDFYGVEQRNRKNKDGQWEKYDAYCINEKFKYGGHGSKSVFIVQNFMPLTPQEAVAINCHMSAFGGDAKDVGGAFEQCNFAWLVSVADQAATYVVES